MENKVKMLEDLLKLTPLEKANIIEILLKSLDEPDAEMDKLWAEEAENRIDGFERGKIESLTLDEFFDKRKE
ncbi:addiction module protein [Shivajiella indica]|uniref:Addiction module protein n=1 Tax=Shivajiella indica TaxID=872115 RepID=A0ABW5B948_9BACT